VRLRDAGATPGAGLSSVLLSQPGGRTRGAIRGRDHCERDSMPFSYRKSINLGGGVRLNVNKKSIGLSAGVKGARVSMNTSRRRTTTLSAPGTGVSWRHTTTASHPDTRGKHPSPAAPTITHSPAGRRRAAPGLILAVLKMVAGFVLVVIGLLGVGLRRLRIFYTHPDVDVRQRRAIVTARALAVFCLFGSVVMLTQTLFAGYFAAAVLARLWQVRLQKRTIRREHAKIAARADADHLAWLQNDGAVFAPGSRGDAVHPTPTCTAQDRTVGVSLTKTPTP